jgi:parallel beta-helix repeat protein
MRHVVRVVAIAAIVAGCGIGFGRPALAGAVGCGSVITADTTLTADLRGCPGSGLTIAGDGVRLDLAGHTISGSRTGVGIEIAGNAVTVANGSVEGFAFGVLSDRNENRLVGTTISAMHVARNTDAGVVLTGRLERIDSSIVSFNGGEGISLSSSSATTVSGNTVFRNGGAGVGAHPHSDGLTVTRNNVFENAGHGIASESSTIVQLTYNTVSRNGLNGINILDTPGFAQAYFFAANVADGNGGYGIKACIVPVPGTTCAGGFVDGGGNSAQHNGSGEIQCLNIDCAKNRGQARS